MTNPSVSLRERLTSCFANVFPDMPTDSIPDASTANVKEWDSIAHITLLAAVSEEFGVELETEDYAQLTSFQAIAEFAEQRAGSA
jgi:acyl carrier protein